MSETLTLDNHQDIREWAAARNGSPAFISTSADASTNPLLRIVFEPEFVADVDRPLDADGLAVVEWDDWLSIFDEENLVMVVAKEHAGTLNNFYQLLKA